ncbi:MAG: hypothetical protein LBI81_01720 [Puniceicoccales bacterium]|nr:hypothetical protein [Puniceicoccales bacterium]
MRLSGDISTAEVFTCLQPGLSGTERYMLLALQPFYKFIIFRVKLQDNNLRNKNRSKN